jgi:hypothetical protein
MERNVIHNNVVKSSLKLGKATVTVVSRFDGSGDKLFDLLLSTAKAGLEKNIRTVKLGYREGVVSCYNKLGS